LGGAGGLGGGGSGTNSTLKAGDGLNNTGGGGGGAGYNTTSTARLGGTGGSGIVVVRYASTSAAAEGGTITSFTGNGSNGETGVVYQVHSFTTVGANQTFAVNNLSAALTGNIAGSDNLTLAADMGKITLAGQNTLSSNTTITGGTVEITGTLGHTSAAGATPAVGSFAGTIANAGKLIINSAATQTLGGAISGAGTFEQKGSGLTILEANNSYSGVTTVSGGVLQIGAGGGTGTTGTLGTANVVVDGAELVFNRSNDMTVNNAIRQHPTDWIGQDHFDRHQHLRRYHDHQCGYVAGG